MYLKDQKNRMSQEYKELKESMIVEDDIHKLDDQRCEIVEGIQFKKPT